MSRPTIHVSRPKREAMMLKRMEQLLAAKNTPLEVKELLRWQAAEIVRLTNEVATYCDLCVGDRHDTNS